jgi:hypothetical protein
MRSMATEEGLALALLEDALRGFPSGWLSATAWPDRPPPFLHVPPCPVLAVPAKVAVPDMVGTA